MKTIKINVLLLLFSVTLFTSCNTDKPKESEISKKEVTMPEHSKMSMDKRMSLKLNEMQKNHQLMNMRDHLEAVQTIVTLLATEDYDKASEVAYTKLGSTTEMKLMCASFGDKNFETLGLEFHKSADKMSKIFKNRKKKESLEALSNTMNYCIKCHATYRQ